MSLPDSCAPLEDPPSNRGTEFPISTASTGATLVPLRFERSFIFELVLQTHSHGPGEAASLGIQGLSTHSCSRAGSTQWNPPALPAQGEEFSGHHALSFSFLGSA